MNANQGVRLSLRSHRLKFDFSASGKTLKCAANEEKLSQTRTCEFFLISIHATRSFYVFNYNQQLHN
jgi:hypothetical protein